MSETTEILLNGTGGDLTPLLSQFNQRLMNYTVLNPTGVPGPGNVAPVVPLTVALYNDPNPVDGDHTSEDLGELICYFDVYVDRAADESDSRCGQRVADLNNIMFNEDGSIDLSLVGEFTSGQGVGIINKVRILGGPWVARDTRDTYDLRSKMPLNNCFLLSERRFTEAIGIKKLDDYSIYAVVLANNLSAIRDDVIVTPESYSFAQMGTTRTLRVELAPAFNTAVPMPGKGVPRNVKTITHDEGQAPTDVPYALRTTLSKDYDVYLFQNYTSLQDIAVTRYKASEDYSVRADFTVNLPSPLFNQKTMGVWLDEADVLNVVCTFADMTTHVSHLKYALTDLTVPAERVDFPLGEDIATIGEVSIFDTLVYDEDDSNVAYLMTRPYLARTTVGNYNLYHDRNYSTYHATRIVADGSARARWMGFATVGGGSTKTGEIPWNSGLANTWGYDVKVPALDTGIQYQYTRGFEGQSFCHYDHRRKHVRTIAMYDAEAYTHAFVPVNHTVPVIAEIDVEEVVKTDQTPLRVVFNLSINATIEEEVIV